MPKEFPFPILKVQELQQMIPAFLSVESHLSDIERPTPEFAQRVYEAAVNILLGPVECAHFWGHNALYLLICVKV